MYKILILGYYNHDNVGDDIFEHVFRTELFNNPEYNLVIDKLENITNYTEASHVIIGGGDLVNTEYFNSETTNHITKYFSNIPVIFYGVGLSFPSTLNLLDIGDHYFMRNKIDHQLVKSRFTSNNSWYTPDIAFKLVSEPVVKEITALNKIGICLPYTWFCNNKNAEFFEKIKCTIMELSGKYEVHLIPFDTSSNQLNSDNILIKRLTDNMCGCKIKIKPPGDLQDTIDYFKDLDCIIGGRFHSIILSMITATPFISIYSSRKLANLMTESPLQRLFIPTSNSNDIPIDFDESKLYDNLEYISGNYSSISETLRSYSLSKLSEFDKVSEKLFSVIKSGVLRYSPPQYISDTEREALLTKTLTESLRIIGQLSNKNLKSVMSNFPISKVISQRKINFSEQLKRRITEEILWIITGDPYAPYYYGLMENVLDSGLYKRLDWLITDYYEKYKYKTNIPIYDSISILNTNFQELHRSGWQFIVDNLVSKLNTKDNVNNMLIDMYVDKTFHWNKSFYTEKGMLPYTQNWMGFIHHTYSSYNNHYNCETLFLDPDFLTSLIHCKCLIVMTKYLQRQIRDSLEKVGLDVPVYVVYHPTESTDTKFTWDLFNDNPGKKVVQVGNWLRNVHAIYQIELPSESIISSKAILKNKNSESYLPPPNFLETLFAMFNTKEPSILNVLDICKITFGNMHVKGLYEYIDKIENSVTELEYLNNEEYDTLLSQNVIFIHLVDASAVNTLVECIVRNTPIIVNSIEPVVEILGPDYPLYYQSNYEVSKILSDPELIKSAHTYLLNMNKDPYTIKTFIKNISVILDSFLI